MYIHTYTLEEELDLGDEVQDSSGVLVTRVVYLASRTNHMTSAMRFKIVVEFSSSQSSVSSSTCPVSCD
jgi:hypothetical protein